MNTPYKDEIKEINILFLDREWCNLCNTMLSLQVIWNYLFISQVCGQGNPEDIMVEKPQSTEWKLTIFASNLGLSFSLAMQYNL